MLSQPFEVSLVEELDPDVRVSLAQLAQLPVLARDERLLHHGELDVQILLRQIEVGRERLAHPAVLVLLEDEGSRLVEPRDSVVVEHLGALELCLTGEARWLGALICLEIRDIEPHLHCTVPTRSDSETVYHTGFMARISLVPQKREFFDLFNQAAANAVAISQKLTELLDDFPEHADERMRDIKELEHHGDRLTHELVDLINRTFVTPFDRDDMYRLAGVLDDICDHVDDSAEKIALYGVREVRPQARRQAEVIQRAAGKLSEAIARLEGFKDSKRQLIELRELEDEGDRISREAIAELFSGGLDAIALIRWKDIHEQLEEAVDACENAADVLEAILVKNR